MKMCITAVSGSLDAQMDPRFGRCAYFMIVDSETMDFEVVSNSVAGGMSGVGIQAAQTIAGKGVEIVITGNVGPNAFQALEAAGLSVFADVSGTVKEAIEKYLAGELDSSAKPSARSHFGLR